MTQPRAGDPRDAAGPPSSLDASDPIGPTDLSDPSAATPAPGDPQAPPTVPTGIPLLEASTAAPVAQRSEVLLITGMSGAGRTRAAAVLEDLDWYVVDNLPPRLLAPLVGMMSPTGGVRRLAAVVDARGKEFFSELSAVIDAFRAQGIEYRIVFLDADDATLVRRFESVRRPHPLQGEGRILDGIAAERALTDHLRRRADVYLDTSTLTVHQLAAQVRSVVAGEGERPIQVSIVSFGFKYGLPLDADHVVDVRFLANPYWVTELRHLTGQDAPVANYVLGLPGAQEFIEGYANLLEPVLTGYLSEQKHYLTIAVGCTGGKHRSVAMSIRLGELLRARGLSVRTLHRDLGRE
ncbi:RNase adapter RapZ [Miniimonas arenae]|uniref:RNase adapter RapZ n=1 Tax=Miniimonas arenae TaxID=676201 RepID=A0A5C5BFA2_9MICO|nr:RNase adapter RapZ [Miniimonas arenae]TNU76998.1 RNase adapter RapZ [Miniimonas arenae]